ncbi:hypothetical protein FCULG_00012842 [Fusarium culmorum]|uniref:Velvet domain-containing protein n=1 Tax=Fusarium culmorum TaxID=5516 RepID=A0A2T4GFZ6_FUSCU|nr:hypothetical protein FCULG_00012842 [Fusarium culmorum]
MNSTDSEVSSMGPRQDPMGISSIISPNPQDTTTTNCCSIMRLGEKDRRVIDPPPVVQLMIKGQTSLIHDMKGYCMAINTS